MFSAVSEALKVKPLPDERRRTTAGPPQDHRTTETQARCLRTGGVVSLQTPRLNSPPEGEEKGKKPFGPGAAAEQTWPTWAA